MIVAVTGRAGMIVYASLINIEKKTVMVYVCGGDRRVSFVV